MLSMLAPKVFNKKKFFLFVLTLKLKTKTALRKHADLSLRPSWSTNQVTGQPGLPEKTLSFGGGRRKKRAYIVLRVYSIF